MIIYTTGDGKAKITLCGTQFRKWANSAPTQKT